MDPSTLVLMIIRKVLLFHALTDVVSVNIYFTAGIIIVCGFSLIVGFIGGGKTDIFPMVRKIDIFWSKIRFLV